MHANVMAASHCQVDNGSNGAGRSTLKMSLDPSPSEGKSAPFSARIAIK